MTCVETGYTPHKFQAGIHAGLKRFSVLVCHRRFGKTVLCINALIDAALRGKPDGRYAYIAPTYKQAKRVSWDYLKRFAGPIPGTTFNEVELRCDLPHGARIQLFGADNADSLRGIYLDGAVLDEYADFPPDAYPTVIRPALSDRRGFAVFIGTPRGHDHLYALYMDALRDPAWYSGIFPVSQTGIVSAEELESARGQMTEAQYRQEYECDFEVSCDDVLIPVQLVTSAIGRNVGYHGAGLVMGLDVGMSLGGDPSAIVIRQGGNVTHAEEFKSDDTLVIAGKARERWEACPRKPEAIYVDSVGWGAGVAHTLAGWGLPVVAVNVAESASSNERFNRRLDELWWRAREFFAGKNVGIQESLELCHKLASELSAPTYGYMPNGKIKIESKDEMKKRGLASPNLADAFVLTMSHADRQLVAGAEVHWSQGVDDANRVSRFV